MASRTALDTSDHPEINADLQVVADQIRQEVGDRLDSYEVDECLNRTAARFKDANIRSFVPLLVRRYARDELKARITSAYRPAGCPGTPPSGR